MKVLRIIFISCSLLLVSACSQLLLMTGSGEQQLNRLLDQQRYQKALQLIDSSNPKHPEHAQLLLRRNAVVQQQQLHIDDAIKQSRQLMQQKQWQQAQQLLTDTLADNSDSPALQKALAELANQQQLFISQQQLALAEHHAKTLPTTLWITEQLLLAEPNNKQLLAQQKNIIKQQENAAQCLEQQVNASISNQQWQSGRRYLQAYQQLKGPNSLADASAVLARQQQKMRQQQRRKSAHDSEQRLKHQQQALQQALAEQDWPQVQALLVTLKSEREQQPAIDQLLDQTAKKMQQLSHTLIQQGQQHYTHGRIDQAIVSWQQALKITPDNRDLIERLQRAVRFQSNIEKLQ